VPAEVERAVRARSRGCCEVPFCDNTHGLELAHVVPHRDGAGREVRDLVRICHGHHVACDAGWLEIEMTEHGPVFRFHGDPGGGRRGFEPPHLRPNPHADQVARWTWSRPPPAVAE
jgi:hypothetical protein